MKTKLILSIFIAILIIFWGCDVTPEIPEVIDPVVIATAHATPTSIAYDSTTTLVWNFQNVTSVTLNENPISNSGSKIISLQNDTTFVFNYSYGLKSTIKSEKISVTVFVGEKPADPVYTKKDTLAALLCAGEWYPRENWVYIGDSLVEWSIDEIQKTWSYKFNLDGTFVLKGGIGNWSFNEDLTKLVCSNTFKLISLTDQEMILGNFKVTFDPETGQYTTWPEIVGYKIYRHT